MLWVSMLTVLAGPFLAGKAWESYQANKTPKKKSKR